MAKAQDLQAQLDAKRREKAQVSKAATEATQAAISARSELATVLDEKQAVELVARERVQSNRARVLNEQHAQLEAEISALEKAVKEQDAATLAAVAEGKRSAAVAALWAVFDQVQAAADAERAALEAKATASGDPYPRLAASMGGVVDAVGGALEVLGAARLERHIDGRATWRKVG